MIIKKTDSTTIDLLTDILKKGGTCVLPCDTIYGLSAIYIKGEGKLKELKERDACKPFLVLATLKQVKELCFDIPDELINAWPAPLTAVLKCKTGGTIGVRVPDDSFLQLLLEKVGMPIYSTSVNISGQPSLLDFTEIKNKFETKVDLLVKDRELQGSVPSTLVDMSEKPYKIIRKGSFDADNLININ